MTYQAEDVPDNIRNNFKLAGWFNLSNLAAAISIAKLFGVEDTDIEKSVGDFKALPHRLEWVDIHGQDARGTDN